MYKQKKFAEAIEQFQKFADKTTDKKAKANAYHNIGNANLEAQKYKESIAAYKKALRENPADNETRYNLSYAKKKLQQQQQKKDEEKKDDEKKDDQDKKDEKDKKDDQNKDNKDKDDKEKKEDENKDKENENKDNKDKNDEGKKDEEKDKKDKPGDKDDKGDEKKEPQTNQISKKDAQRMLDALNNQEKKVQAKLKKKKAKGQKVTIEKDW